MAMMKKNCSVSDKVEKFIGDTVEQFHGIMAGVVHDYLTAFAKTYLPDEMLKKSFDGFCKDNIVRLSDDDDPEKNLGDISFSALEERYMQYCNGNTPGLLKDGNHRMSWGERLILYVREFESMGVSFHFEGCVHTGGGGNKPNEEVFFHNIAFVEAAEDR